MFERFTESARQVVVLAQEAARSRGDAAIDSGHLLWGVLRVADGPARDVLGAFGVGEQQVRDRLGPTTAPGGGKIPFGPAAKHVLERSLEESLELRARHISPAHLLLAMTHDASAQAASILHELGAEPAQIRQALLLQLTAERRHSAPPAASRSFVEDLTLALRHAEDAARRDRRPVDAGDLLLGLGVSPLVAYAIRTTGVAQALAAAREGYGRLEQLRRDLRDAFAAGELGAAEELRAEARRLRDELEGRG